MARLEADPPDAAIVTMMGYWDIFLVRHLHRMGVPVVVMVHDAEVHPATAFTSSSACSGTSCAAATA